MTEKGAPPHRRPRIGPFSSGEPSGPANRDLSPASLARTLARGGLAAFVIQGGGQLLRYLWQVGFARWMGVEAFGSFSFVFGWIQVLGILAGLGLTTGTLRFSSGYVSEGQWGLFRGILRRSAQITLLSGAALAVVGSLVVLALPLSPVGRENLLLGLFLVPVMGLVNVRLEATRSTRNVARAYFPVKMALPALAGVMGFGLWAVRGSLSASDGILALGGALGATLLIQEVGLGRAVPPEGRMAHPEYRTGYWLRESFPLLLIAGFVILLNETDVIMVGLLAGDEAVGLYAGAAVTARWVGFALLSANAVAAPMIASLHTGGNTEALQNLVSRVARWTFWPSLGVAAVLILGAGPVLHLFGGEFGVARGALSILVLGQLVNACMGPVGHLMTLTGHGRQSAMVYGTAAGVNVVLDLLLIPIMGMEGAAVATAASMVLWNAWLFFLVRRNLGVHSLFLGGPGKGGE